MTEPQEQATDLAVQETGREIERGLESEQIVVSAPFSYHGSAARIWKITRVSEETAYKIALGFLAVLAITLAWILISGWYLIFGLLLVPYRLIRRGQRKRKVEATRHRELLGAVEHEKAPPKRG